MELSYNRNAQIVAVLLILAVVTQGIYTALYLSAPEVSRLFLWRIEAVIFVLMAAFAGTALVQAKTGQLAWSAITAASVLNVVQVGVGLTMFGPFFEAAAAVPEVETTAYSVVEYSFMVYNGAKMLLALAALALGLAMVGRGAKVLGWLSAIVGGFAVVTNALSMSLGRDFAGELPLAGGPGVLATLLLAICLLKLPAQED